MPKYKIKAKELIFYRDKKTEKVVNVLENFSKDIKYRQSLKMN
jgi:hypothetical protein